MYCGVLSCWESASCPLHANCPHLPPLLLDPQLPVILDGGLATTLEMKGFSLKSDLWSAEILSKEPQAIYDVHMEFLKAGSEIITTASYQASVEGFVSVLGVSHHEAVELLKSSARLAKQARDDFWSIEANRLNRRRPVVAFSLGCFGAALSNGSEYTGDYGDADLVSVMSFHLTRLNLLLGEDPELLACETIPNLLEAKALSLVLQQVPQIPAWVTFCCKDGERVSSGEFLRDCLRPLLDVPNVIALGVNCTNPQLLPQLLSVLQQCLLDSPSQKKKMIIVYPNSGEVWDLATREWIVKEEAEEEEEEGTKEKTTTTTTTPTTRGGGGKIERGLRWVDCVRGRAQMVGGCCRVSPAQITALRKLLRRTNE